MKSIIKHELNKFKQPYVIYAMMFLFMLTVFLPNVYTYADGRYFNEVITFKNGVNGVALRTNKDQYCAGDLVQIETAFCKNRDLSSANAQWYISNGQLVPIPQDNGTTVQELPIGCYPEGEGLLLVPLKIIPKDTNPGFHKLIGLSKYDIGNEEYRFLSVETIPFEVISCNK